MNGLTQAMDFFHRGGPVMWPILFCSILGLTVALERLIAFWRDAIAQRYFRSAQENVIVAVREGRFDDALQLAQKADAPTCRIFAEALANHDSGFTETLEAASQKRLDQLRRGFTLIDTVITVSPMLGILGTVTGIINTFTHLTSSGIENPTGATAGISEALITTAAGLIVAISCLFPFNFLVSQLSRRANDLEQATHRLTIAYEKSRMLNHNGRKALTKDTQVSCALCNPL